MPSSPTIDAHAHCDIPCGLYDPHTAQLAAKTVATMVKKISELKKDDWANFVRMVTVKEQHAELCKRELLILWTDYFKPNHLKQFPELHETVWNAAKLCSFNKQNIDADKAAELQKAVDKIAAIFKKAEAAKK